MFAIAMSVIGTYRLLQNQLDCDIGHPAYHSERVAI